MTYYAYETAGAVPRCFTCGINKTKATKADGRTRWVCVCCDPAFQKGTLDDCQHGKEAHAVSDR